jgi:hypothetical protein
MIQDLIIEETSRTPQVEFKTNGDLLIKGRSVLMDVCLFFQPLIDWVSRLTTESVIFNFNLDYFNSSSSKKIFEILRSIDLNMAVSKFDVIWNYEVNDEVILERGQIFEEKLQRARFIYREYEEA